MKAIHSDQGDVGKVEASIFSFGTEQNLLLMRYWIGLSHKEVAQALDMPEGTVRRRCAEALAKLRERWTKDE